jgi:hypothetical protein
MKEGSQRKENDDEGRKTKEGGRRMGLRSERR